MKLISEKEYDARVKVLSSTLSTYMKENCIPSAQVDYSLVLDEDEYVHDVEDGTPYSGNEEYLDTILGLFGYLSDELGIKYYTIEDYYLHN